MNMTFFHVPTPQDFEIGKGLPGNLAMALIEKKVYIALVVVGNQYLTDSFFDVNNPYNTMSVRWYVPCSVKYPRWSSIFRILSVELWIVLIISTVIATI
jgi:hypothetical protein